MNTAKFFVKAFLAGIIFTGGVYFTVIVLFPAFRFLDDNDYYENIYKETIRDTEGRIGKSCANVHEQAKEFVENDIDEIIAFGLDGGDWITVITPEQKEFIELNDDWLADCDLARNSAAEIGEVWPEFTTLHRLFSTLNVFSTSYCSTPATAIGLNPQAFEDVQYYYRSVTSKSKSTL